MSSYRYPLPPAKDDEETRIYLLHEAFRKTLDGRLLNAPVAEPVGRVLDIGSGTGVWTAEFATEYPTAEVVGIDLSLPTIPPPPNCHFLIQNAEQDWEIGGAKFDIIHTRLVPWHAKEVPALLRRCYENLKPGGYIELQEIWTPRPTDEPPGAPEYKSKVVEWTQLRKEAVSKLGIDQTIPGRLPGLLSEAGFAEVHVQDYKWPIGPWMEDEKMKEIGSIFMEVLQLGKMELSLQLLAHLGMSEREIIDLVEQVGKELGVGKIYSTVRFVTARKPE
ncbi:sam dependent methyltransferase [Xylariales sp. AK1849]|nr:sam dependent methyltransferase [Xylariales sp. AK1849]